MNRMLLTTAMSAMLAIAAPGVASAHNAKGHRHAHHHHAKRATVRTFGSALPPAGAGSTTSPPATPAGGETAGTVTSFTGGVLTITLTNGSTVSGQVTERTEIHCQAATTSPGGEGDQGDDEGGDGSSSGHDGAGAVSHSDGGPPTEGSGGEGGSQGDGSQGDGGNPACTSAALVAGAVVREAELSVSGSGAVWDHVDLIQ